MRNIDHFQYVFFQKIDFFEFFRKRLTENLNIERRNRCIYHYKYRGVTSGLIHNSDNLLGFRRDPDMIIKTRQFDFGNLLQVFAYRNGFNEIFDADGNADVFLRKEFL